jgi:hypothetical protein
MPKAAKNRAKSGKDMGHSAEPAGLENNRKAGMGVLAMTRGGKQGDGNLPSTASL